LRATIDAHLFPLVARNCVGASKPKRWQSTPSGRQLRPCNDAQHFTPEGLIVLHHRLNRVSINNSGKRSLSGFSPAIIAESQVLILRNRDTSREPRPARAVEALDLPARLLAPGHYPSDKFLSRDDRQADWDASDVDHQASALATFAQCSDSCV
jgi:hypothetical protein